MGQEKIIEEEIEEEINVPLEDWLEDPNALENDLDEWERLQEEYLESLE